MLLRKADCHDHEGLKLALEHGADPTLTGRAGSLLSIAARRGRGDILEAVQRSGVELGLAGVERVLAACACNQPACADEAGADDARRELFAIGGSPLAEFAGNGNHQGLRRLLDLGIPVGTLYAGDGYFGIPAQSTALHVAAWKGRPESVGILLERGAAVDQLDGQGQSALVLAVRACVDSYWTSRRSPESVRLLLAAGACPDGVPYPSGYAEVDALLREPKHGPEPG